MNDAHHTANFARLNTATFEVTILRDDLKGLEEPLHNFVGLITSWEHRT